MIVIRSMDPGWLSSCYLVADEPGGSAVLVDSGGPTGPIVEAIETNRLRVTHLLCTHHHADHVAHNQFFASRYDCPVLGPAAEAALFSCPLDGTLEDGDELESGRLRIRCLATPGHTRGMLAFLVVPVEGGAGGGEAPGLSAPAAVFTGDTLFAGTVGGTMGPGHATFSDLKRSIMEVLMKLPPSTAVHPGHAGPTTIDREWRQNPFVRIWRGLDPEGDLPCTAMNRPARLVLRARDYDGGTKCWVRFAGGEDAIAPGSRVAGG